MNTVYLVVFFITGLVLGSFYNVVGLRICKNESIVYPSSHCTNCNHKLKFYELIPVLSYIFLGGRCKKCKEKISVMYPLIELFTGILFALSFYSFGFSAETLLLIIISSLFVIIIVTDLNYYIIPDIILVVFGILILIYNFVFKGIGAMVTYLLYGALMFLFMFVLMKLGNAVFKEESLGGGDIKLMGVLGMTLKPIMSFFSLSIGAFVALPISLYIYKTKKDKIIPFGPFIVGGFLIVLFMKIDVQTIVNLLKF